MFPDKRTVLAALVLSAAGTLLSCSSSGQSVETNSTDGGGTQRAMDDPILGVSSGPGMPLPECDQSIVRSTPDPESAASRLSITGQAGDSFSYELTTRDGDTVTDSSGALAPAQNGVTFNTGVAHRNIHHVTISAKGTTGVDGECTLHSGQRAIRR